MMERKHFDEALRLTQFTVDRAADSIFWIGPDAGFLYVNEAAWGGLGYTQDELLKMAVYDIDPDWTPGVWPKFWQNLKEQKVVHFESKHRRKDGSIFPVEITTNYLEFDGHEYDCAIVRDITERKLANEDLRKSQENFEEFFENAVLPIHLVGPDGIILRANPAELDMLGYSREEFEGRHIADFHVDQDVIEGILTRLLKGESLRDYEARLRHKDGSIRDVLISSNARWENDTFIHTRCFTRDITERNLALVKLRHAEAQLNTSQEMAHVGSWDLDLVNNHLWWSDEVYRIFEVDSQAFGISYEDFLDLVHPSDREWVNTVYTESVKTKIPYEIVHRLGFPDGRIKFVHEFCKTLYDEQGNPERSLGTVQDITQRKEAEAALRESEAWFKAISEAIPHQVWTANPDGTLDYVNPKVIEYFERPSEQIIGWNWTEVLHPDDLPVCLERWAQAREQGTPYEIEFRLQRASDHTYRWFIGRALPFKNQKGQIIKWFGTCTDISDRKMAEEVLRRAHDELEEQVTARTAELRQSLKQFQILATNAPVGIFKTDALGSCEYVNERWCQLGGMTYDQAMGQGWAKALHPDDREGIFEKWSHTTIAAEEFEAEFRFMTPEGVVSWVQVSATPLYNEEEVLGYLGTVTDMTGRREAEIALRENEERLKHVLAVSPAVIYSCQPSGEFGATFVSSNITLQLGYDPEQFTEDPRFWTDRIHPEDKEHVFSELDSLFEDKKYAHEYRFRHKDGTYRWMYDKLVLVRDEAGNPLEIVGSWIDITARKILEKDILNLNASLEERVQQRTVELEMKNAELERFTYAVSHDLKSPLVTIQGFLKMVGEDAHAGRMTHMDEDLKRIQGAAQKMRQLLNEVLELSRVGKIVSSPEPVAMGEVIRDGVEQVRGQLAASRVHVDIAPNWPVVLGDRPRLVEVVQNLLENASKFMGAQPEPWIELGVRQNGEETVMFVRDNGMGIDPQYQEKIFGLFERLDARTEGTGIGLALVKRIIEVQGGRIWVESEGHGHGSTFCFVLPKGQQAQEA